MANLPGDHDTFMLYQPEAGHLLTRHLMEAAGLRQEAAEQAFERLGQPRRVPRNADTPVRDVSEGQTGMSAPLVWPKFDVRRISPWLPCVCTEREDLPRLLPLLQHTNGWVRINAAKAIAWLGDPRAIAPVAEILANAKAEADYGWSKTWKDEEFNDPCPRWREALLRALGLLKATQHVGLITKILDDERSVLEVRHAAAEALADIANDEAMAVLRRTATAHPYGTVRQVARDALLARGIEPVSSSAAASHAGKPLTPALSPLTRGEGERETGLRVECQRRTGQQTSEDFPLPSLARGEGQGEGSRPATQQQPDALSTPCIFGTNFDALLF
ncbi:MAG: HEAT repeat domain-containing protein, partial [Verrucomicrobia bacterium]|nr:HEAT repeat domain-containing protein [Verrucomicrobiota bacterium]